MSRSIWKLPIIDVNILRKKKKYICARNSVIPSFLIEKIVFVHNGRHFIPIKITREKVGFKFGEFSFTRKIGQKKKKKKR